MKKAYIQPQVEVYTWTSDMTMAGSGVTGDNGIGWGGVDEEGNKDPDANSFATWETEDEVVPVSSSIDW
ncbi:MAG: hypothetical protein IKT00_05995 [Prevotella sp.]|nr:hypothetical protein [Prevotella sp.]